MPPHQTSGLSAHSSGGLLSNPNRPNKTSPPAITAIAPNSGEFAAPGSQHRADPQSSALCKPTIASPFRFQKPYRSHHARHAYRSQRLSRNLRASPNNATIAVIDGAARGGCLHMSLVGNNGVRQCPNSYARLVRSFWARSSRARRWLRLPWTPPSACPNGPTRALSPVLPLRRRSSTTTQSSPPATTSLHPLNQITRPPTAPAAAANRMATAAATLNAAADPLVTLPPAPLSCTATDRI